MILLGTPGTGGVIEIYAGVVQSRLTARQVAGIFRARADEADEAVVKAWGDPTALTSNEELHAAGIPIAAAFRDVEEGIKAVNARPAADPPTVRVQRSCARLLAEISNYRRGANGKPIKVNDHACDCFRYMVIGVDQSAGRLDNWTAALQSGELSKDNPWI